MEKGMSKVSSVLVILIAVFFYLSWHFFQPVEIVASHYGRVLLVRNFPLLKFKQIVWWEKSKESIYVRYGIPVIENDGGFRIVIHDFGDGYKEDRMVDQDSDLLCFEDMKSNKNCIEKRLLMTIDSIKGLKLIIR